MFLVGVKRRRNAKLDAWLDAVDETKPSGLTVPAASTFGNRRPTRPARAPRMSLPEISTWVESSVMDFERRLAY
ncbi:MAG: hypothetical protein JO329_19485 [Planctomycetaceae bacterium]|nr:hypothetical protein [Planctomycetaceae bacterium]